MTVSLHDNIMAITADFLKNDLYLVPVLENGQLVGVVTRTEIKKALLYGMRDVTQEPEEKPLPHTKQPRAKIASLKQLSKTLAHATR